VPPILGGPVVPGGVPTVPVVPPVGGDVVEPASLLLTGTGIGVLFLLLNAKLRGAGEDSIQAASHS
jgi:hypothetical protein